MRGGSFLPEVDIMEMLLLACAILESHKTGRESTVCCCRHTSTPCYIILMLCTHTCIQTCTHVVLYDDTLSQ